MQLDLFSLIDLFSLKKTNPRLESVRGYKFIQCSNKRYAKQWKEYNQDQILMAIDTLPPPRLKI